MNCLPPSFHRASLLITAITLLLSPTARAQDSSAKTSNATPDLYDSNRVVKIDITLAPADWDNLRNQQRDTAAEFSKDRLEHPVKSPYTWFSADVTIDGTHIKNVGLRKRGFIGSADTERPGLNLEFDKFVKGQKFARHSSLKLHNNKQDGSNVRQALAYQVFNSAGVPAPRCNLATVSVNGKNLGVYSNIEPIDSPFLKRHFGSDAGNLYEAQVSDFRPGWTRTFEKKNNGKDTNRDDLDAVVKALQAEDSALLTELGRVLDIDAFITFWAVESLINHWDGFTGDLNNSFIYHDPASGKLRFIPWGADGTFGSYHILIPFDPPSSVWAVSFLPRRLYNHPVTQKKYRARYQELLATVWNEKNLLAETDRLTKLVQGSTTIPPFLAAPQIQQLHQFISNRRGEVEAELKQPPQPWSFPMRREVYSTQVGKVSAQFSSAWVPSVFTPSPAGATAHVTLDFYGRHYQSDFTDVKAAPDISNPQNAAVMLTGHFKGVEVPVSIWFTAHTNFFAAGKTLEAGGKQSAILVVAGDLGKKDWRMLGGGGAGSTRFTQAQMTSGSKVEGTIETEISNIPWEDFDLAALKKAP
jgi:hypothetical protein